MRLWVPYPPGGGSPRPRSSPVAWRTRKSALGLAIRGSEASRGRGRRRSGRWLMRRGCSRVRARGFVWVRGAVRAVEGGGAGARALKQPPVGARWRWAKTRTRGDRVPNRPLVFAVVHPNPATYWGYIYGYKPILSGVIVIFQQTTLSRWRRGWNPLGRTWSRKRLMNSSGASDIVRNRARPSRR